ncbi:MobA/MobL family protein [Cellvibrio sp. pealriver]|uniref:MobA/MobL family protein n=1 Tax=Cellvibrio sp. pealriver TaxID=1622269 RepID=UPI0009E4E11F|nr:MobA/MobL family protein [Cellvibrio sp. pealriver]
MAIFYCPTTLIARSKSRSATASAAYRAAEKIVDERTGIVHDFKHKTGVLDRFLFNCGGLSRAELWNLAEKSENRSDSRVAREWTLALPHELKRDAHQRIIARFSQSIIDKYHVAIDVCVHAPGRGGDHRNLHAHLLMTTRPMHESGCLGKRKTILEWSDSELKKNGLPTGAEQIKAIREKWADVVNFELEAAGLYERISHLSLKEQGIEKIPQIHVGPLNTQLARMGYIERASRWQLNEKIKAQNNLFDLTKMRILRMQQTQTTSLQDDAITSKKVNTHGGLAATWQAAEDAELQAIKRLEQHHKTEIEEIKNREELNNWKPAQIDPEKGSVIAMFQQDAQGVYRWTKGQNEGQEAFRDAGKAIHSQTINSWALAAELELAKQKVDAGDWKEIRAFGSEQYRRAIWIQGQTMNIQVNGYTPTKEELAKYGQAPSQGLVGDEKSIPNRFAQASKFENKFTKNTGGENSPDQPKTTPTHSQKI